jgi:hypothetical protein
MALALRYKMLYEELVNLRMMMAFGVWQGFVEGPGR